MNEIHAETEKVFLGLGSNLGNRNENISAAIDWLKNHPSIQLIRHTDVMETEPWGIKDQGAFLNMVAEIHTDLSPHGLLDELKKAELLLGRKADHKRWGPREIDLDILLYGNKIIESQILTIPHERLIKRSFVIAQLIELEPDIIHPKLKVPIFNYL